MLASCSTVHRRPSWRLKDLRCFAALGNPMPLEETVEGVELKPQPQPLVSLCKPAAVARPSAPSTNLGFALSDFGLNLPSLPPYLRASRANRSPSAPHVCRGSQHPKPGSLAVVSEGRVRPRSKVASNASSFASLWTTVPEPSSQDALMGQGFESRSYC